MACVLITGTSTGIGLFTALHLARAGHTIYATLRRPDRATELRQAITAEKLPIFVYAMDVDSDASVASTITAIRAHAGFVDALVNNAGIERRGSVEELALDDFRATMETNYFGALRCIRALLPAMRQRRQGCIINISSIAGQIATPPLTSYAASKAALEALSEALAQEVRPFNIRVAIVQPGVIDTPMARHIEAPSDASLYPHTRRFANLFTASLSEPRPPLFVAEVVRNIIETDTWQLRHPAGPDAAPFLAWRAALSDEEWVAWGSLEDTAWYNRVERDFGINARPSNPVVS